MLSINSFRPKASFLIAMIFAALVVAMNEASANAPTSPEITTIASARDPLMASSYLIDTTGAGSGEYVLSITLILDNGNIEGTYYRRKAAVGPVNVHGKITVERGNRFRPTITTIAFTAGAVGSPIVTGGTVFQGAIHFSYLGLVCDTPR